MTEVLIHPKEGSVALDDEGNVVPLDDAFPDTDPVELTGAYRRRLIEVGGVALVDATSEVAVQVADTPKRVLSPEQEARIDELSDKPPYTYSSAFYAVTGMSQDDFYNK